MRTKKELAEWLCVDCNRDTLIYAHDYYMLKNSVWKKYGVGKKMLCLDCIESRLNRPLKKSDLVDCPLNKNNPYTRSIIYAI